MMTAFLWVIIGDLVSFHIELIYGDKQNHSHQPFTKSQKDDGSTYKIKSKTKDNSSKSKKLLSLLVKTDELPDVFIMSRVIKPFSHPEKDFSGTSVLLRAPPSN